MYCPDCCYIRSTSSLVLFVVVTLMFWMFDDPQVGASVAFDASSMNELRRWNEQYGEGGNRRKSTFGFAV